MVTFFIFPSLPYPSSLSTRPNLRTFLVCNNKRNLGFGIISEGIVVKRQRVRKCLSWSWMSSWSGAFLAMGCHPPQHTVHTLNIRNYYYINSPTFKHTHTHKFTCKSALIRLREENHERTELGLRKSLLSLSLPLIASAMAISSSEEVMSLSLYLSRLAFA